jgi:hypothetical protein
MSLDYRPKLLSHQLFRETVPLTLIFMDAFFRRSKLLFERLDFWFPSTF